MNIVNNAIELTRIALETSLEKAFIIDTETTGFDKPVRPCEVAYIELPNLDKLRDVTENLSIEQLLEYCEKYPFSFVKRYNPERPIHSGASKVNGIFDSDVVDKESYKEVYKDIPQEGYFIAHRAVYDWGVLFPSEEDGIPYKLPSETSYNPICTKQLAKIAFGYLEPPSYSLIALTEAILEYLKVDKIILKQFEEHTALGDCKRTLFLLLLSLGRPEFKFQFLKHRKTWTSLAELCNLGEAYERNSAKSPVLPEGEYMGKNLLSIPRVYRLEIYNNPPEWLTGTLKIALSKSLSFHQKPKTKTPPQIK